MNFTTNKMNAYAKDLHQIKCYHVSNKIKKPAN